jgi:hypothetical protein
MSDQSNARIISIILALFVVVGGWLLFEYDNRSHSSRQVAKKASHRLATHLHHHCESQCPSHPGRTVLQHLPMSL